MVQRRDNAKIAILKALNDIGGAAGASRIMERLLSMGLTLQPRTIRYYLLQLDSGGLTQIVSRRRGRVLTDRGREELAHSNVIEKVGFIAAKVDTLGYRMTFNNRTGVGTIITNVTVISSKGLSLAIKEMAPVFERGFSMGQRLMVVEAGKRIAGFEVPEQSVAIGTVCSVTVNGIMLAEGIPVTSRFGGLLEVQDGQPVRFIELIDYGGSTVDPIECFIRAGMTQVRRCARTGTGVIAASFREIPSVAVNDVQRIRDDMAAHGLSGILAIGRPNRPLLDMPVAEGRAGMIVVGGLNPAAALHEAGMRLHLQSLAGLEEISQFSTYEEVQRRHA